MCGIFAAIAPKGSPPCRFAPHATRLLAHRGPDTSGTLHVELAWASVTLGMTRLKIVDQSDLFVPYDFRESFGVVLAYNGEVYNWRELRAGLPGPWSTDCDAEVVAALWRQDGPAFLDKLNGMWGLVLVDTWADAVFVSRDRAGEKPLYWAQPSSGIIYLASEAKALPVALERGYCPDMDVLEFDCGDITALHNVFAMPPGSCALVGNPGPLDQDFYREIGTWWKLPIGTDPRMTWHQAVDETQALLVDAIKIRHVAERPVAVQLSGGLDSAIIQAVVKSDHLYCVTFPEADNLTMAKEAAFWRPVKPVTFTLDELLAALPAVAYHLDTPATWTAVCQWFLNRKVAEAGNVVVLSGEGADELFGGYARYRVLHWLDRMLADTHLKTYTSMILRALDGAPERFLAHMLNRGGEDDLPFAKALVRNHSGAGSLVSRMSRTDFYTTMQVLLRMADRMAAAFSLENRSPFFDYRLMELAGRMPAVLKVTNEDSKAILRAVADRLGVPSKIVREQNKKGLFVPLQWGKQLGTGLEWDRKWFATRMTAAWEKACLRPALCESCKTCRG